MANLPVESAVSAFVAKLNARPDHGERYEASLIPDTHPLARLRGWWWICTVGNGCKGCYWVHPETGATHLHGPKMTIGAQIGDVFTHARRAS